MPALSPTMTEGTLVRWIKKVGDEVKRGDVVAEIETDKTTLELEALDEGRLATILVEEGAQVAVNQPIAILLLEDESDGALETKCASSPLPSAQTGGGGPDPQTVGGTNAISARSTGRTHATPMARRMAAEASLDLSAIQGSGPNGRIEKRDVVRALSGGASDSTVARRSGIAGNRLYQVIPNSPVRKSIARRVAEAKATIPHFYLTTDCNVDGMLALRKELNGQRDAARKLSVNDFIVRAAALTLRKVPELNAVWTEQAIHRLEDVDISIAVDTPDGIVTPIVRNADRKDLDCVSTEIRQLAKRARDKELKPEDYEGGGFTISNLGMHGVKQFEAIINPPQVAILAVGAAEQCPIVRSGELGIGLLMSCTLSCDHRAIDGATGAKFMQAFRVLLEDPQSLV